MIHKILCCRCKKEIERSMMRDNAVCFKCKMKRLSFYAKIKRKLRNKKITSAEFRMAMYVFDKNQIL